MKMTFRWYGSQSDSITLSQIKQIPGMTGIMGLLDYKAAGEVWTEPEIRAYIDEVHAAGLECEVIESVNVHEDIKMGLPGCLHRGLQDHHPQSGQIRSEGRCLQFYAGL